METGRCGPVGDVEDLGHLGHGEVEVVVQDDDDTLVDRESTEHVVQPVALGELGRRVRCAAEDRVGHHVQLDPARGAVPSRATP